MPSPSVAVAVRAIAAGAVNVTLGGAFPVPPSKNTPATTAPPPPAVCVTCTDTCPRTVQVQYWPPLKPAAVRVSRRAPVAASRTSNRCTLTADSQSSTYRVSWCDAPSTRLISIENVPPYHVAAIRSAAFAFCNARPSLVDGAHVQLAWPLGVTTAADG